jgi:hypothetical protein
MVHPFVSVVIDHKITNRVSLKQCIVSAYLQKTTCLR